MSTRDVASILLPTLFFRPIIGQRGEFVLNLCGIKFQKKFLLFPFLFKLTGIAIAFVDSQNFERKKKNETIVWETCFSSFFLYILYFGFFIQREVWLLILYTSWSSSFQLGTVNFQLFIKIELLSEERGRRGKFLPILFLNLIIQLL